MNYQARILLSNIIRKQNSKMIEEISTKYDLDVNEMKRKYLTPTFYDIMFPRNNIYNVVFENPVEVMQGKTTKKVLVSKLNIMKSEN